MNKTMDEKTQTMEGMEATSQTIKETKATTTVAMIRREIL